MLPYFPQYFSHGVMLLMLATLPLGLSSRMPRYKSASLVPFLCISATWIKLAPTSNQQNNHVPTVTVLQTQFRAGPMKSVLLFNLPLARSTPTSDQNGIFNSTATAGNSYLMVVYDYDSNCIHVEPLQSQSGPCIVAAYQSAHNLFTSHGFQPRLQRLDNEASNALLQFMASNDIDVESSPPHIHRRNAAERAIHTFKTILSLAFVQPTPSYL
jgi:hypothetical protein